MSEHVVIFGGGGFIGRALVSRLVGGGRVVVSVGRAPPLIQVDGAEYIVAGGGGPRELESVLSNSEVVIHLASGSTPGSTAGRPVSELEANLRPTLELLEAMQSFPHLPLLYVSSAGSLYADREDGDLDETTPVAPRSYHGAAKAALEHFVGAYCRQFNSAATVLRPSNVYGPGQVLNAGFGIVPHALAALRAGERLTVWGDGSSARDYLYIDDLVELCVNVLEAPMPTGLSVFNAGSGVAVSLNELFSLMEEVTGLKLAREYDRRRAVDAACIAVNADRAWHAFGWEPAVRLDVGIRRTWEWLKSTVR